MSLVLQGSWPASLAAAILLLTKARRFGFRLNVGVVQQTPIQFNNTVVLFRNPLLVGLGVSGSDRDPSMVLTKGDCCEPLSFLLQGQWLSIDRSGAGISPETKELIGLFQSYDQDSIALAQTIRFAALRLGVELEPSIIDLFFQTPTIDQGLILVLQLGRTLSGRQGDSITETLFSSDETIRPNIQVALEAMQRDFKRVGCVKLSAWMEGFIPKLKALSPQLLMMSLGPSIVGLKKTFVEALGSIGPFSNPIESMQARFTFLGGNILSSALNVIELSNTPFPDDPFQQWDWLSSEAAQGASVVESVWRDHCDPSQ